MIGNWRTKDNIDGWGDGDINGGDEEEKDDGFIRSIFNCPPRNVLLGQTCSEHAPLLCQRPPEGETRLPFLQFLVSGEKSFDWSCSLNTSWKHYKCTYGKGSNGEKRLCGILLLFLARFVIAIFDILESLYYYLYFKQSLSIYPGCCNSSLEPGGDSHCLAVGHCSPSWLRCYHQGLHLFLVCYNI